MKKNQVNTILVNQTKRRNTVLVLACMVFLLFIFGITFINTYIKNNKADYITYKENSYIQYAVNYKQNEFFDNKIVESNRQYIASLIDNIVADFNYRISLDEEDVEYKYTYRVEANVSVKDKTNNNLFYSKNEIIIEEKEEETSNKQVNINERIDIDYNHYNNLMTKFVSSYGLREAESTLNINMFVNVVGTSEKFEDNQNKEAVITLSIPLTKNTMAITFEDNIVIDSNKVMKCDNSFKFNFIFLLIGINLIIKGIILTIISFKYEVDTRTAESIYEKSVKKILNNYSSCIQMIGNEFYFKDYQLLKIDSFDDMLEISDKLRQPILMKENPEKTGAYFVIPSSTKLLYVFRIKVSDIEKEINKKVEIEDIEELDF